MKLNVSRWIEENKSYFLPPVSNKLMHDEGQINVMFVGGPNQRKDFHIEAGEELFYMIKGDMVLKVLEKGCHRDIPIKEGEIFLLPRCIPHSPQRFGDTVGLVIERRRQNEEYDSLRYFIEHDSKLSPEILYDMTFQWNEAKDRLPEFFKRFFDSEEYRTGKPRPGTVLDQNTLAVDSESTLQDPFSLKHFIDINRANIDSEGRLAIFDTEHYQMQTFIYGKGETTDCTLVAESWIWQLEGQSTVQIGRSSAMLNQQDSLLIPPGNKFTVIQEAGSIALVCYQDPTKVPKL